MRSAIHRLPATALAEVARSINEFTLADDAQSRVRREDRPAQKIPYGPPPEWPCEFGVDEDGYCRQVKSRCLPRFMSSRLQGSGAWELCQPLL